MTRTAGRRIRLLALGGTIACRPSRRGLVPALRAADLVEAVETPGHLVLAGEDLLERTIVFPEDWVTVAEAIGREGAHGYVVTLGTDTLAHAAAALSLMLQGLDRPVVLTGAMSPMGAPDSDAVRNLSDAVRVAAGRTPGVFVVFDGQVIEGRRASKVSSEGRDAFRSVNAPPCGRVGGGRVRWRHRSAPAGGELRLATELDTRVACVKLAPQTVPGDLKPLRRCSGLVVEGYGDGNVPGPLVPALAGLARERLVVLTSQCPFGCVAHRYEGGLALVRRGVASAGEMTTEYALVRVMWALGQSDDLAGARRLFEGSGAPRHPREPRPGGRGWGPTAQER